MPASAEQQSVAQGFGERSHDAVQFNRSVCQQLAGLTAQRRDVRPQPAAKRIKLGTAAGAHLGGWNPYDVNVRRFQRTVALFILDG